MARRLPILASAGKSDSRPRRSFTTRLWAPEVGYWHLYYTIDGTPVPFDEAPNLSGGANPVPFAAPAKLPVSLCAYRLFRVLAPVKRAVIA